MNSNGGLHWKPGLNCTAHDLPPTPKPGDPDFPTNRTGVNRLLVIALLYQCSLRQAVGARATVNDLLVT